MTRLSDGKVKLYGGWLIEKACWEGYRIGWNKKYNMLVFK